MKIHIGVPAIHYKSAAEADAQKPSACFPFQSGSPSAAERVSTNEVIHIHLDITINQINAWLANYYVTFIISLTKTYQP